MIMWRTLAIMWRTNENNVRILIAMYTTRHQIWWFFEIYNDKLEIDMLRGGKNKIISWTKGRNVVKCSVFFFCHTYVIVNVPILYFTQKFKWLASPIFGVVMDSAKQCLLLFTRALEFFNHFHVSMYVCM